jgi:FKBP-type peptidyl-prolyl cis-trans isomerase
LIIPVVETRSKIPELRITPRGLFDAAAFRQQEIKEMAERNLSAAKAFMEENKKKEGVKTLPSGLQYKVLTEGSGKNPQGKDSLTVHYRGTFVNGTEFDSSYKRDTPLTLKWTR